MRKFSIRIGRNSSHFTYWSGYAERVAGGRDVREPLPNRKDPLDGMVVQDDLGNRNSSKRSICPKHSTETTEKLQDLNQP